MFRKKNEMEKVNNLNGTAKKVTLKAMQKERKPLDDSVLHMIAGGQDVSMHEVNEVKKVIERARQ